MGSPNRNRFIRFLLFWQSDDEEIATDKEKLLEEKEKTNEQTVEENSDETIASLKRRDTERHQLVKNSLNDMQKQMRCHILRAKAKNGGLTPTEEAELVGEC